MTTEVSPPAAPFAAPPAPALASAESLRARSLASLDWSRVLEGLAARAATTTGKERCRQLPFLADPKEARARLAEVHELMGLLREGIAPALGGIIDVRPHLTAAKKGEILDGPRLLEVAHTLEGFQRLVDSLRDHGERAPKVWGLVQEVHPLPDLAAWFVSSFDARGELSASTYPQLTSLRTRKSRLHAQIRETIEVLTGEERYADALMDDYSTLRNDRYVLPIKASNKRAGLGIVHDASGTGQTVYIEPFELIELNNELKMAEAELEREQRRILADLTRRLALVAPDVAQSTEGAVTLDVVTAKSRLGVELDCTVPEVSDGAEVALLAARHPILCLRGLDVVPNDLRLGGAFRALVLSGPNTGGKTVTLKTLGLAALMARAALPFPCAAGSRIGWFVEVLTDIGDLQDVQGDLSTFSGHVLALTSMFDVLDRRTDGGASLVLLDEIAVGTDPVQGAALGRAVLEAFLDRGACLATTTHYPELKALAAQDPRFLGGRVEFDGAAGRPTYRLTLGRPGSSHALDVAERMGMAPSLLARARALMDPTAASVEKLLAGLESELSRARVAREEAERLRAVAEASHAATEKERLDLERRVKTVERDVRGEFEKEVAEYRATVRGALKQLRVEHDEAAAERARVRITDGAHAVRSRLGGGVDGDAPRIDWHSAAVGTKVRVVSLDKVGQISELPDLRGRVTVTISGFPVQVKVEDLQPASARSTSVAAAGKASRPSPPPRRAEPASTEDAGTAFRGAENTLDLRGQRSDEALFAVDRFLDAHAMRGAGWVFLLHGHGTGALLRVVREHLRDSPYVARSTPGTRSQGGEGVTAVLLR